jgi:hypothetical protein
MRGVLRWQAPIWEKMHVVDFMVVDSFSKSRPRAALPGLSLP